MVHSGTLLSAEAFSEFTGSPKQAGVAWGELILLPQAKFSRSKVERALLKVLACVLDESRVHLETGYQLSPETWLQPDVSVIWPDQRVRNDYLQGSPIIAIEVVYWGNTGREIDRKIGAYREHGAAAVWIRYPKTRSLAVHT